jgi:hypothetical protein
MCSYINPRGFGALIVSAHVAVRPFDVVAVIVAVPTATACMIPDATPTVATAALLVLNDTDAPAMTPLEPETVAVHVMSAPPVTIACDVGDTTIDVGVLLAATVTAHVAVCPFAVEAVIVADPAETGVHTPVVLTVATPVAFDDHVTGAASVDPAAFLTVGTIVPVEPPAVSANVVGATVIVAGVVSADTVTVAAAVLPLVVVTVIVVEPGATA